MLCSCSLRVLGSVRLKISPLAANRVFCSDDTKKQKNEWSSILGDPTVQSPFSNPNRKNASPFRDSQAQAFLNELKDVDEKENPATLNSTKASEIPPLKTVEFKVHDDEKVKKFLDETSKEFTDLNLRTGTGLEKNVHEAVHEAGSIGIGTKSWFKRLKEGFLGPPIDESLSEADKRALRMARKTKLGCIIIFGSLFISLVIFCFENGKAPRDANGNIIGDEFSGKWLAPFYRITNALSFWKSYITEPSRELLLPEPIPLPYHQPKYTLVIELKNVLLSPEWTYKTGYRFKKRPALDYFLEVAGYPNFELVLYTSEHRTTIEPVVAYMDPKHRIMHHLFRHCTKYMNGHHVKDLSRLNRDLKKVIFIDFDPKSFQLNPENALLVNKWEGNMDDRGLIDLAELLKTIHLSDVEDVRPVLQYYSQFDDPLAEFRRRVQMIAEEETKASVQKQPVKSWFGTHKTGNLDRKTLLN